MMMVEMDAVLEAKRRDLWIQVAIAVAASEIAFNSDGPGIWANKALDAYDAKFKRSVES